MFAIISTVIFAAVLIEDISGNYHKYNHNHRLNTSPIPNILSLTTTASESPNRIGDSLVDGGREKRGTDPLKGVTIHQELFALFSAVRNVAQPTEEFCAVFQISKDLISKKSQFTSNSGELAKILSIIEEILGRVGSSCSNVDASGAIEKALEQSK